MNQLICIEGSARDGINIHQIFEEILLNFEQTSASTRKAESTKNIG